MYNINFLILSLKIAVQLRYDLKSKADNFSHHHTLKGTMKSSIIKMVTQTQFKTSVTAFITLDFKIRREKLSGWDLR